MADFGRNCRINVFYIAPVKMKMITTKFKNGHKRKFNGKVYKLLYAGTNKEQLAAGARYEAQKKINFEFYRIVQFDKKTWLVYVR